MNAIILHRFFWGCIMLNLTASLRFPLLLMPESFWCDKYLFKVQYLTLMLGMRNYISRKVKFVGDIMNVSQKIIELAQKNNGVITTEIVVSAGYLRGSLKYLSDIGKLERVSRGVYTLPEVFDDDLVNFQTRFKKGIYSLETALFLCDLTDRTPLKYHMTFPATYNLTSPKREGLICNSVKDPLYDLGVIEKITPGGNSVRCYSAERSLCDILLTRTNTDIQVVSEAFKHYVVRPDKNIPLLSEYSKILKVEKKIRSYLEVLL